MLALIPVLINTNGDDSFAWFLRLSVCFRMVFLPGLKAGGSLVRVGSEVRIRRGLESRIPGSSPACSAVNSEAPAVPSGTAYVTSDMPATYYTEIVK